MLHNLTYSAPYNGKSYWSRKQGKSNKNVFIKKIGVKQIVLVIVPTSMNKQNTGGGTCPFFMVL